MLIDKLGIKDLIYFVIILVCLGGLGIIGVGNVSLKDNLEKVEAEKEKLHQEVKHREEIIQTNDRLIDSLSINMIENESRLDDVRRERNANVDSVRSLSTKQLREYFTNRYHLSQ